MYTTTGKEILQKYGHYNNTALAAILKRNGLRHISSSRNIMLSDLIDIKMRQSKVKNPLTPERVRKWDITKRYECDCQDGGYKDIHMGIEVELTLDDGQTRKVDLCQNSTGLNVARPINERMYNSSSKGKKKHYINTSVFYPIQHWIAQELTLLDMWETY